jgi:hypothetical protein
LFAQVYASEHAGPRATYQQMLQEIRAYFREMNVVEGLADAMLRVDPKNIRLLSEEELANYGLTPVDPIAQEAYDLTRSQIERLGPTGIHASEITCRNPMWRAHINGQ